MERPENKELVIIELERQLTHCIPKSDLRKVLKKWYQYEWSGEQDSLYIDLKKLLEDE